MPGEDTLTKQVFAQAQVGELCGPLAAKATERTRLGGGSVMKRRPVVVKKRKRHGPTYVDSEKEQVLTRKIGQVGQHDIKIGF
jgi:hypothetical protein